MTPDLSPHEHEHSAIIDQAIEFYTANYGAEADRPRIAASFRLDPSPGRRRHPRNHIAEDSGRMTTLPWMPVFPGDELAETSHLSTEEYGAYALLKMALWQHGAVADDDERLSRITRLSLERWLAIRAMIEPLFGPRWTHEKLEHHRALAAGQREKKSAAGKKGALGRWGVDGKANGNRNGTANGVAITKDGSAMPSANDTANADANGLQPQMKNSAYEKEVLTHAHPHAREKIPKVSSKLEAGQWLDAQGILPMDAAFNPCVDKMLRGELDWPDIERAIS
ncbi:YdaU family protein [Mesorhizobium sangaii]|uniref:Uncharacterized protein YdaU (DUF1376 family) n=1 Tax=Mesorhizobium sangaii TaxID=505389 RepID=A0A841P7K3_9HYPH|nr:DUF1376 domain-containing protein [Mesorhizobium sangaii]MBB6411274.1 uncharacterized protein YdaU (DUF1376 family) [Mesorhizobium sangaii]